MFGFIIERWSWERIYLHSTVERSWRRKAAARARTSRAGAMFGMTWDHFQNGKIILHRRVYPYNGPKQMWVYLTASSYYRYGHELRHPTPR